MLLQDVLNKFISYQICKGSTNKTISYYRQQIQYFIDFSDNIDISNVTLELYEKYVIYLKNKKVENNNKIKEKNLSSHTIKTYITALKSFLNFAYNNGYIKEKIYIPSYKTKKNTIVVLSGEQIKSIIGYYKTDNFFGVRDLLIISLMLDCGLRVSEVCYLNIEDISCDLGIIRVNGKGQKQRLVPLSESTEKYFNIYIKYFKRKYGALIVDYSYSRLTTSAISSILRRLKKELGFEKLNPHYFRHTFATLFLLNGGDPINLQTILGHTTLKMTEEYIHIANQMSIANQKTFSPLSNLNKK